MNSIVQNDKECLFCGTTQGLHKHHLWHGTSNRANADKYGLWVWLCAYHHEHAPESPHRDRRMDIKLMQLGQSEFERQGIGTREEFMAIFGKNVLDD